MRTIQLTYKMADDEADKLGGILLDDSSYDELIEDDCDVIKPNGDILLKFRRNVIPKNHCAVAYPILREAATISSNRGMAGGIVQQDGLSDGSVKASKTRFRRVLKDGTLSKTHSANPVHSGIVGYFDRNPRYPYCRLTAFNLNNAEQFALAMPFIQSVNEVFAKEFPERYAAQMDMVRQTSADFFIHGTSFTTVTVNRNWQTAVHKDVGDLKEGFGVMSAFRAGNYSGCNLIFPAFRVAVNMRTSDVLLADVHEWHGNSPFHGQEGTYERLSCVFYYRSNMFKCGNAEEELERAKNTRIIESDLDI